MRPFLELQVFIISCSAIASDYLEIFITMGAIDISLYVGDNNSPEVKLLKPPPGIFKTQPSSEPRVKVSIIYFYIFSVLIKFI